MHSNDCECVQCVYEASQKIYEELLAKLDTLLAVPIQKYNHINNKENERKELIKTTKNDSYQCHFRKSSTHVTQNIQINSNLKNTQIKEKTPWHIITHKINLLKEQDELENILQQLKTTPLYEILNQFLEIIGKGKKNSSNDPLTKNLCKETGCKSLNNLKNKTNISKNVNLKPNKTELNLVFNPIYLQAIKKDLNKQKRNKIIKTNSSSFKASNHSSRRKSEKMNRKRLNSSKQTNISCKRISHRTSVYSTTHQRNRLKSAVKVLESKKCKKRVSDMAPPSSKRNKNFNKIAASQKIAVAEPPSDRFIPSKRKLEELSDICKQTRTVNLLCKQLSELSSTSERIRLLSPRFKTKQTYINCRKTLKPCKEEGTATEQKKLVKPSVLKEIQHAKRKYDSFNVNSNVSLRSVDIMDKKHKTKNIADESLRKQELRTIYSRNFKEHNNLPSK